MLDRWIARRSFLTVFTIAIALCVGGFGGPMAVVRTLGLGYETGALVGLTVALPASVIAMVLVTKAATRLAGRS